MEDCVRQRRRRSENKIATSLTTLDLPRYSEQRKPTTSTNKRPATNSTIHSKITNQAPTETPGSIFTNITIPQNLKREDEKALMKPIFRPPLRRTYQRTDGRDKRHLLSRVKNSAKSSFAVRPNQWHFSRKNARNGSMRPSHSQRHNAHTTKM